jgi:hypothetical protein
MESSVIRAVGYTRVLEIEFQDGRVYQYFDVDEAVYQAFLASDSKGRYFNAHIRGQFPYQEIAVKSLPAAPDQP